VIADPSHKLTAAWGVLLEDGAALRATFVVDPEGVVRHAAVTDLSVGRSVDETLRVVQALQTGELCPVGWRPGQATLKAA
jgi:alkyl hydroperoxide reductase subunit AhpC